MNLLFNIILDLNSIIMLIIIGVYSWSSLIRKTYHDRIFISMIYVSIVVLFLDIFSRFDGQQYYFYPFLNQVNNSLIFLFSPVIPMLWLIYVINLANSDEKMKKRVYYPLFIVFFINAIITLISQKTGWYYKIDSMNMYHRGPLFLMPVFITVCLLIASLAFSVFNREKIGKKHFLTMLYMGIPILSAIVLQVFVSEFSLTMQSTALSILIVYLGIQSKGIRMDHLTGAGNRKMLDEAMQQKINTAKQNKTFAAIMIDLDGFKNINDKFGHNAGDEALINATNIIRNCIRSDDILARYGGDEFIILLNHSSKEKIDQVIQRLKEQVEQFNNEHGCTYMLDFSIGFAIYEPDKNMEMNAFLKHIDTLMYIDKHSKRLSELGSLI